LSHASVIFALLILEMGVLLFAQTVLDFDLPILCFLTAGMTGAYQHARFYPIDMGS
jgi:hypothetical protein